MTTELGRGDSMNEKLLLVEDNRTVHKVILEALSQEGYDVSSAFDGTSAIFLTEKFDFSAVILDMGLPDIDGQLLIEAIRKESMAPILVVSAKDNVEYKANIIRLGADDYLAKPLSMLELKARVQAALRRYKIGMQNYEISTVIEDIEFRLEKYVFIKNSIEHSLTKKEAKILELFFNNPNKIITKKQLYEYVWHDKYYGDENVINVHMKRIRNKIEADSSSPRIIQTVWGIGYQYKTTIK